MIDVKVGTESDHVLCQFREVCRQDWECIVVTRHRKRPMGAFKLLPGQRRKKRT